MASGSSDLFVVCKSCGSEVSAYITECPYCGSRLRKRAPKLPRDGEAPTERRRRTPSMSLGRLRPGEIPGIAADSRPYATIALVVTGMVLTILWIATTVDVSPFIVFGGLHHGDWWHVFLAPLAYGNTGYAFVALLAVAIFGWLLERRHGALVVLALFALGGAGGIAVAATSDPGALILGGNGAALALIAAWSVPDLIAWRQSHEFEGDLIGAGVLAAVLLIMPVAASLAHPAAGFVGLAMGLVAGVPLARRAG